MLPNPIFSPITEHQAQQTGPLFLRPTNWNVAPSSATQILILHTFPVNISRFSSHGFWRRKAPINASINKQWLDNIFSRGFFTKYEEVFIYMDGTILYTLVVIIQTKNLFFLEYFFTEIKIKFFTLLP